MTRSDPVSVRAAGRPSSCSAEERLDLASELDDHGIPPAILRGGDFDAHPTLGHVVFVNIGLLDTVEEDAHTAYERLFAVEGAARIDGEVIRWDVCRLLVGHVG